jgi:curved DNA-binding protein CbpA
VSEDDWDFSREMFRGLELEKKARGVLGVRTAAGPAEIRRAFWKLAKTYHPDLNPGDSYRWERFMLVAEAYDILTKRNSPIRRYQLARAKGHLPQELTEEAYLRWWVAQFGDLY